MAPESSRRRAGGRTSTHDLPSRRAGARHAARVSSPVPRHHRGGARVTRSSYSASARSGSRHRSAAAAGAFAAGLLAIVLLVAFVLVPQVKHLLGGGSDGQTVAAGQQVTVVIPEGSSGDAIAKALAEKHVIDDPKNYYTAVKRLGADAKLKPGTYLFTTGQDPEKVVKQLMEGPNVKDLSLTVPEGLTVQQTADVVQKSLGISADEFVAQAKASNYASDYPFLAGAYNDSLEGFLYPKTYTYTKQPTADQVIRSLLGQFQQETSALSLDAGAHGLTMQQVVSLASLVERETAVADERPEVASVIYNRLAANMALQVDAAVVYARGGGSAAVSYSDLEIDSPYNTYKYKGLTPGPICSPSISSIKAALDPASTDYLYYVASSSLDGTHRFTKDYNEFLAYRDEYNKAVGQA